MNFEHVIITRYDLGLHKGGFMSRRHKFKPSVWYKKRKKLFHFYCAPSMVEQSNTNFKWLVIFDKASAKARIDEAVGGLPCTVIRCSTGSISRDIRHWVRKNTKTPWLLTTRVDTDDALSINFVNDLQSAIRERREALCFERGWMRRHGRVFKARWPSNPFVSLMEPTASANSIMCMSHADVIRRLPYRTLPGRTWLRVEHGMNLTSMGIATHKSDSSVLVDDFPFLSRGA